jgi:hypothetical protein
MLETSYTWQPVGELLVETGILTPTELATALAEQRRTGRLVGEILVESGYVSAFTLGRALASQHGVDLQPAESVEPETKRDVGPVAARPSRHPADTGPTPWRPLGKLLIEKEFLTRKQLEHALDEQRASGGLRLLGEILVGSGVLSGLSLARALAEQQGLELESGEIDVTAVLNTSAPGQDLYQVREVVYEPRYQALQVMYKSVSFLEAADFAAEFVEDLEPEGVEIERTDGTARETVWTYSKERAAAAASSRTPLAETFGFDPTLWDGANAHGPVGAARWPTR